MQYSKLLQHHIHTNTALLSLYVLLGIFLLSGCGGNTFSEDAPFGVQVHRYRYPQEALSAKERLEEMELDPYLIAYEPVGEGPWYGVFMGASASLEDMLKDKMTLEDEYGLQQIDRANFHQITAVEIPFPGSAPPLVNKNTVKAPMEGAINSLLKVMPQLPNLRLREIKLLNTNTIDITNLGNLHIDFPRGIVPRQLFQSSTGLVSAFYEDQLMGKETHLIGLQLKEEHPYGDDVAQRFAESVLGTRRYEIENMSEIKGAFASGYTVSIVPSPGKTKIYMVLYEPKQRLLFLGESRAREYSIGDWNDLAQRLGASANIWNAYELNQMMSIAPDSLADPLVYFRGWHIPEEKGKGAAMLHDNLQGDYMFYNPKNQQTWKAEVYRFASPKSATAYYHQIYENTKLAKDVTVDSVEVSNYKAFVYIKKRRLRWKKYEENPVKLVCFAAQQHIASFYFNKSGLSAEEMTERARAFRWEKEK